MTVCRQYVEALPDSDVTTIFIQGEENERIRSGVSGQVLFMERAGENLRGIKFSQIFRLYELIKDQNYDVVIAHRYKAIYLAGILSYFKNFPKMIGVAHEHKVFKRVTRKLFVTFWRKQFEVCGVSDSVVRDIAKYCPSLVSENRLHALPNVLASGFEQSLMDRKEARQDLGLSQGALIIGTTGRFVRKKSLPLLLEAFSKIIQPNVELVFIGDGPERSDLEQQAIELDIEQRVQFLGFVPDAGRYTKIYDLFVLPSGSAEAFGIVLLEAMMSGVPVIASTAAGPSEVVGDQQCLFIEGNSDDLAAKIEKILNQSDEEKSDMLERNRTRVQEAFSAGVFRTKLAALLS